MAQLELPTYRARVSRDWPDWLLVWCPRDECGTQPFLVHKRTWIRPRKYKSRSGVHQVRGRSCPYCFKAAALPKLSDIGAPQ